MRGFLRGLRSVLVTGFNWALGVAGLFAGIEVGTGGSLSGVLHAALEWAPFGFISGIAFALGFRLVRLLPIVRRSVWWRYPAGVVLGGLIMVCWSPPFRMDGTC